MAIDQIEVSSALPEAATADTQSGCLAPEYPLVRLSLNDVRIVTAGFQLIAVPYWSLKINGHQGTLHPDLAGHPGNHDRGKFDGEMLDRMMTIADAVSCKRATGGRFQSFDAWDISSLILAVRFLVRQVKHGHAKPPVENLGKRSGLLLKRLENARKKAKRHAIKNGGRCFYDKWQGRWSAFQRWLRLNFLDCMCLVKNRRPYPFGRADRLQIDLLVEWTVPELRDREIPVPPAKQLRREISLAISYIRRRRRNFTIRDLTADRVFAASHLSNFILRRLEKIAGRESSKTKR